MDFLLRLMEQFFEAYLMPILTFVGGGGAVYLINWKSIKKQAEAEAMKVVQDVYQQTIQDLKSDKDEMRSDNTELRKNISELKKTVQQNTKDIEVMKRSNSNLEKSKCLVIDCKLRKRE